MILRAIIVLLLFTGWAVARDDGRYAQSPLKNWFNSLRNQNGIPCCDTADGVRLEDPNWRINQDGSYSVRLNKDWIAIDPQLVIKQKNLAGYAIVWINAGRITCFLPGSST
jgi:hypothetical protein